MSDAERERKAAMLAAVGADDATLRGRALLQLIIFCRGRAAESSGQEMEAHFTDVADRLEHMRSTDPFFGGRASRLSPEERDVAEMVIDDHLRKGGAW